MSDAQVGAGHGWQPCQQEPPLRRQQQYAELPDGLYEFQVAAADQAGNADATPTAAKFVVDSGHPDVAVTDFVVFGQQASVGFAATKPGCTFECTFRLHAANASMPASVVVQGACTSPHAVAGLPLGNITFDVVATDTTGRRSSGACGAQSCDGAGLGLGLGVALAAAHTANFVTAAVGPNSTAVSEASVVCQETKDAQLLYVRSRS